jgi:hypothetical protein
MSNFRRDRLSNERGMVSFVVVIIFLTIISLIVVGFAQVSRRNSRETLDRQLASQAYYAAETGINDAMNKIAILLNSGNPIPPQKTCNVADTPSSIGGGYTRLNGQVDPANPDVLYSCLLVNPVPSDLQYTDVDDNSVVIPLSLVDASGNPVPLGGIDIKWEKAASATGSLSDCSGTVFTHPPAGNWNCPLALMRADIVPIDGTSLNSAAEAAKNTMTLFLYPSNDSAATATMAWSSSAPNIYGTGAPQGIGRRASCTDQECHFTLTGMNGINNAYMRLRAIYVPSATVTITSTTSGTGFANAQVAIDSTGKAQDVLRRILVRSSIAGGTGANRSSSKGFSDYALQAEDSICKRYEMSPNSAAVGSCP